MTKTFSLAIVLFAAACSKSDTTPAMVPASVLDEQNRSTASETSATASSDLNAPDLEDAEGLPGPSEEIYAGGSRGSTAKPSHASGTHEVDPDATIEPVEHAVAVLIPTKGNKLAGTIRFVGSADGIEVVANLTGLPKGKHAFHVHMTGDCSAADASSAGGHFTFSPADAIAKVTGNLGDLEPKADGSVTYATKIAEASLQGSRTVLGRSVVVHQASNEMASAGAPDKRLACGVIGIASEPAADTSTTRSTP